MDMEKFMVLEHPESFLTETYRKVAANIEHANIDKNIKTIMVTSSVQGEGKTTTVCNIACVMTELNKNILLVDLDFRKPFVHKFFNLSNKNGFTDLLYNKDDYTNYIKGVCPRMDVITAGINPFNPAEILNSRSIREVLNILSMSYDYVFLDTPPIAMVSDPIIISAYVDAVIMIMAYGYADKEIVRKSVNSLKQVHANIIGTVLNKSPLPKQNKHYYNYR